MEEFAVVMNLEKRSDLIYDYQKLEFYKIDRLVHHHNFHSVSLNPPHQCYDQYLNDPSYEVS